MRPGRLSPHRWVPPVVSVQSTDRIVAIAAGVLLALMIEYNSALAQDTTPVFASWVAHGLGAAAALVIVVLYAKVVRSRREAPVQRDAAAAPLWVYLGGIPGALTVILAAITVNSSLALSGTIALMLVGQVFFGMICDHIGMFRSAKRRFVRTDLLIALSILTGSALIIFGGG